jgi:hypothetical protein
MAQLADDEQARRTEPRPMRRLVGLLLSMALAGAACSQAPSTGQQPGAQQPGGQQPGGGGQPTTVVAPGDITFTVKFDFDTSALDPDVWNRGSFTTSGDLSTEFLMHVTEAPTFTGSLWQSTGNYQFSDWHCATPDECLEPCIGSYGTSAWQDKPQIGLVSRSGSKVVVSALLSANPKPDDDSLLQTPDCPITTGNAMDGFPRMKITIDGVGGSSPQLSIEDFPYDGTAPAPPGVTWSFTIKRT